MRLKHQNDTEYIWISDRKHMLLSESTNWCLLQFLSARFFPRNLLCNPHLPVVYYQSPAYPIFLFFRLPQRELFRLGNSCAHSSRRATLKNVISASINIFNYRRGTDNLPVFRGLNCTLAYSYTVGLVIFWAILYANSTLQKSRKFDRRSVTELLSVYDRSLGTEEFSRLFLKLFMLMQTAFS